MVKFYIVAPPGNGDAQSLFTIAASTLGDGSRYMEIFSLNKGRLQPNGGRLTSPQLIEPGWILRLPADAAGPGVHFGPLPVATALAPHRPSRPGGTGSGIMISGALLVSAGVALWLIRRRAQPAARQTTKPATRPASPVTQPPGSATRPATPAERPARRSRQFRAMRLSVLAMTIPILFGLIAATTQLGLHGYGYFVFRSAGTGATQQGPSGPAPSQPPAAEHRRPAGPGQVGPRGITS